MPQFKGGTLNGDALTIDQIEDIAKLPARNVLDGQLVGVLASPVTSLVRGLNQLIAGLAIQLGAIAEQGLVGGEPAAPAEPRGPAGAEEAPAEPRTPPTEAPPAETEASGDEPAENENTETPSEGDTTEEG